MSLIILVELACSISHSAPSFFGDGVTTASHSTQHTNSPRIHMRWIWVVFYVLFTFIFIIFPWIQSWIFLSSSEHKSDTSTKLYIPMARSHFQVAVVNSELGTVYEKSKLGFSPQVPHFKFIYSEFHLSFYCRHSMSSGSSAIHTQPLSLVPWII